MNNIKNVFQTEESVIAARKKRDEEGEEGSKSIANKKAKLKRGKKSAPGKAVDEKARKKASRKAAKRRAKEKAAAEAAKLAAEKLALKAREEKARLAEQNDMATKQGPPPKHHPLGHETKRLWVEDECVVLLHNGRVLSHTHKNVSCIPASMFEEVSVLVGFYIVQIGNANGVWSALDREGTWHKFTVERHGVPRKVKKSLPLKKPWLERKRKEREAEAARLAAIEAARQAALDEERRLAREAEERGEKGERRRTLG